LKDNNAVNYAEITNGQKWGKGASGVVSIDEHCRLPGGGSLVSKKHPFIHTSAKIM
jgi:hypothetical protein